MASKKKAARTGLSDAKVQQTLSVVKAYWPDYPITKENILHPTKDFVLNFFQQCINNLDDKVDFLVQDTYKPAVPSNISVEMYIYLRLKNTPLIDNGFKLGDLYRFDPKRLNTFIYVICHYLCCNDTIIPPLLEVCRPTVQTKARVPKNKERLEALKEENINLKIELTQAKEEKKNINQEIEAIKPRYEQCLKFLAKEEEDCKVLVLEKEELECANTALQEDVKIKEEEVFNLQTQVVTEEENQSLFNKINALKTELQELKDLDYSKENYQQKIYLERMNQVSQELGNLVLPDKIFKLADMMAEFKREQEYIKSEVASLELKKMEIVKLKTRLGSLKENLETENEKIIALVKDQTEHFLMEEAVYIEQYKQTINKKTVQIEECKNEISIIEYEYKTNRETLEMKLSLILVVLDKIWETYKNVLAQEDKLQHY